MKANVLLVEDSKSLAVLYQQYVKNEPYDLFHVETGSAAKTFIRQYQPQLVILDLKLPDMTGEAILDWIIDKQLPTSVIIVTAHGSVDIAIKLIQKGAHDFLEKPIQADRLKTSIMLHLKQAKLEKLVTNFESQFNRTHFQGFIGQSLPMQAVYKTIESAAPTNASIFIHGESGTGKEVCAEAIHNQSPRANKPFIAINCGAIARDLMHSEIFGHVKGAFTGATSDRKGAAMLAHEGTLFLDELCEMELDMQKKLLRFLQTGTFTPLGGTEQRRVDVRIICATNRDPLVEVSQGHFREDLYYRVHVIPIELPALRERDKDIITLATHFMHQYAKVDGKSFTGITPQAQQIIQAYSWPGNVRQLQNVMRNIVVLNDGDQITVEHLPAPLNQQLSAQEPVEPSQIAPNTELDNVSQLHDYQPALAPSKHNIKPMWQVERETIQEAIAYCKGNILNAAVLLDLSPSTLYRKKQQWEAEYEQHS